MTLLLDERRALHVPLARPQAAEYAVRPMTKSAPLTTEALLAVLAGLTLAACEKKAEEAQPEAPATASAAAPVTTAAAAAAPAVSAKEIPSAAGSAEKAGGCAPGGCAPGKCAANK
jgi:hypothetical protein